MEPFLDRNAELRIWSAVTQKRRFVFVNLLICVNVPVSLSSIMEPDINEEILLILRNVLIEICQQRDNQLDPFLGIF